MSWREVFPQLARDSVDHNDMHSLLQMFQVGYLLARVTMIHAWLNDFHIAAIQTVASRPSDCMEQTPAELAWIQPQALAHCLTSFLHRLWDDCYSTSSYAQICTTRVDRFILLACAITCRTATHLYISPRWFRLLSPLRLPATMSWH